MAWQSIFSLGTTGPTGSVLYSNGNGKLLSSDTFTVGETAVNLGKDLVPTSDALYNLGATGFRWGEIFVGPGTINIAGPSGSDANGLIGTDNNSIIYTQRGFATPFINIGPSEDVLLAPGLIGGWRVGPTGTIGEAEYDLVAQAIDPTGGATGPIYSLINRVGPTGPTGETGAQGPQDIPSAFDGTNFGATGTLIDSTGPTGTLISTCYITTSVTGYIWITASAELTNTSNNIIDAAMYVKVDGTTSAPTTISIPSNTGSQNEQTFASVTVHQRTTTKVPPGGYTGTVYAYATGNGNTLSVTHCDTFALGNLS
jgi:hypothetical protein